MICAPIQFDVPTISEVELEARFAQERSVHLARLEQVKALAREYHKIKPVPTRSGGRGRCIPVRCIELKRNFVSIHAAMKFLENFRRTKPGSTSSFSRAIRNGWKCGGFHWKYA